MNYTDIINAGFQGSASIFALLNCIKLHKDKKVHGVSVVSVAFFASWGYWNFYK